MCCEMYFRKAIHSPSSGDGFISKRGLVQDILLKDNETKSDKEGDFYGG